MLDKTRNPKEVEDSLADVNPYEFPDLIWSLIESYFDKYKVDISENHPTKMVSKPTVVWTTIQRTPGREGSKVNGRGSSFAKFLKVTPEGFVHELHQQQQTMILEYSVYAPSSALVKRIAWDLERAVLETVGVLQDRIEGLQLTFQQQTPDSSLLMRQQDEIIRRTVRFEVLIPVKFVRLVPELRTIELIENWGQVGKNGQFNRESSDKQFYVPAELGQRVTNVRQIYLNGNSGWKALEVGVDYWLRKDADQITYIEWNDNYGNVPQVGQDFKVEYDIVQLVKISNIKPQ
jgi:hypothetical protein